MLAKGWVTRSQLERAFANQQAVGGGLDTCLLEMNALSEERLAEALAQRYGVPAVDVETLRGVPEEVRAVVPQRVAERCSAVPFAALGTLVRVAMQNPEDLGCLDELSFSVGRRIEVDAHHVLAGPEDVEEIGQGRNQIRRQADPCEGGETAKDSRRVISRYERIQAHRQDDRRGAPSPDAQRCSPVPDHPTRRRRLGR